MFGTFLQVALGGAIGASARWALGLAIVRVQPGAFPLAILTVNVLGSAAMGFLAVWLAQRSALHLAPFVLTGVLGGFTTFSAFSLEVLTLYERGQVAAALAYVALSVVLSVGGLALGVWAARMWT